MLESFAAQSRRPEQIIVVDGSGEPVEKVVHEVERLDLDYLRWTDKPSAAAQRNGGLKLVRDDIELVCFFDDDQILHPDALEKMLAFWESAGPEVGGAAFNLANPEDARPEYFKRSWLAERLGLYARRPGAVAPSGWQSLYDRVESDLEVEWLSSQAIVLRRSILEEFRFDEFFDGYSYLEDLDFGVPAIQCIADFSWDEEIRTSFDPPPQGARGLFHRVGLLRKCYLGVAKLVAPPSDRNLFSAEDLILANSQWSAQIIKDKHRINIDVLYPPVLAEFPKIPFQSKATGFVCKGCISPDKRIERIMEILKHVRLRGYNIYLDVIGGTDRTPYGNFVEEICLANEDWRRFNRWLIVIAEPAV